MRDQDCHRFPEMVFVGLILLRRRFPGRSAIQMTCPARSWFDRLGGLQLGGQLRAGVADDIVDAAAVLAAALGSPQAQPERVRVDRPGRVRGAEFAQKPGDRIAVHSDPPGPPYMGRFSSSGPTVPRKSSATTAPSQEPGRALNTSKLPPTSAASRARARPLVSATSSPAAGAWRTAARSC